ncbi:hypothetical protein GCM10025734_64360 [Kitasatospora paranensis]
MPQERIVGGAGSPTATRSATSGPVTAADVGRAVGLAVATLTDALAADWHTRAGDLDWDCWETLEHTADGLFAYAAQLAPARPPLDGFVPLRWRRDRPEGPPNVVFVDRAVGAAGLLQVLETGGGLLAAMVATVPPEAGPSTPTGCRTRRASPRWGWWRPWCTPTT